MSVFIQQLRLSQFRCYESLEINCTASCIALVGPNGAGKTNILEALSFLSPGRGLRGASLSEIANRNVASNTAWSVFAQLQKQQAPISIGTGYDGIKERRKIHINTETASQADLAAQLSIVWLTPQMDRLFLEAPSGRRRFIDRLIFGFDPAHSGRINRYEKTLRERSKILKGEHGTPDPVWLNSLEETLAQTGIAIAAARLEMVKNLQTAIELQHAQPEFNDGVFPVPQLSLAGTIENDLSKETALNAEERFRAQLVASRATDSETGGAAIGPHKTDFLVWHRGQNSPAEQCSTGEQKALLLSIILAYTQLLKAERGQTPILLLDEVAAHLDPKRRETLFDLLQAQLHGGQCWMTGTDAALFRHLEGRAQFFYVEDAQIKPGLENAA